MDPPRVNVADRLATAAQAAPDQLALVEAWGHQRSITIGQLDHDAGTLARGLLEIGVEPQLRLALLVKPSIEFVTLVFALLRSGATMVLVDSGLGRKNIVRCLASTEPEGFVAIPLGHALRIAKRRQFPKARLNVNVGPGWLPWGTPLSRIAKLGEQSTAELPRTTADDPAAIVFTSGSTGPPKGVVYRHETFATQLAEIQRMYDLHTGGVDLACFPLFGLFNVAMGITTVLPEMDFSRPAAADPEKLLAAANQYKVTQSFASPAVWDKLSRHCENTGERIPTLKKVFSCGAPVSAEVIERTLTHVCPGAEMHTPYGATESLPVSTIEGQEILTETAEQTRSGAGVCVGRKVESIEWRVIKITDEAIATIDEAVELPQGEIGELIVRGPQVSRAYIGAGAVTEADMPLNKDQNNTRSKFDMFFERFRAGTLRSEEKEGLSDAVAELTKDLPPITPIGHNRYAKIKDGAGVWHRTGDVGYFDYLNRFWFCGRKSQRVQLNDSGNLYTVQVESVANSHPSVVRSALVGTYHWGHIERCILVVERTENSSTNDEELAADIKATLVRHVPDDIPISILFHSKLPTDIRHNAKINREKLAEWAAKKLKQNTNFR